VSGWYFHPADFEAFGFQEKTSGVFRVRDRRLLIYSIISV
jgi:hypothetical protein